MALMVIGIDTSYNKQYSCLVSGFKNDVDKLYNEIDKILVELNQKGPFHWRRIRDKVRKSAKNKIYETVNNNRVYFTIFEHKSAQSNKMNYLTYVPNSIANRIENWLRNKYGTVLIKVDQDYEIKGIRRSTEKFVRTLLFQIGFRLAGTTVHIRKNHDFVANIGFPNGRMLQVIAGVSDRNSSKEIQLSDLILGYYLYDKSGLEKKVRFIKI